MSRRHCIGLTLILLLIFPLSSFGATLFPALICSPVGTFLPSNRPQTDPEPIPNRSQTNSNPTPNQSQTDPKPNPNRPQTDPKPNPNRHQTYPKPTPNLPQTDPKPTPNRKLFFNCCPRFIFFKNFYPLCFYCVVENKRHLKTQWGSKRPFLIISAYTC